MGREVIMWLCKNQEMAYKEMNPPILIITVRIERRGRCKRAKNSAGMDRPKPLSVQPHLKDRDVVKWGVMGAEY